MTFNNRRILHSRTSFKLNGGVRHLQVTHCTIASQLGVDEGVVIPPLCQKEESGYAQSHTGICVEWSEGEKTLIRCGKSTHLLAMIQ